MRRRRRWLVLTVTACLGGIASPADAQVSYQGQLFPPTESPRRARQPLPTTEVGPASGLGAPSVSTRPGGTAASASGASRLSAKGLANPLTGTPYPYRSTRSVVRDIQARLGGLGDLTLEGQDVSTPPSTVPAGLPLSQGLPGSRPGLDALSPYTARGIPSTRTSPSAAAASVAQPSPKQESSQPVANGSEVSFDQFESYEEFRAWLNEQLAQPGGGAVGQALARLEAMDQPQSTTAQSPQDRGQPALWGERPPIGYVGVGSNARMPLGRLSMGGDVAQESARLVAELNQYLSQSRQSRSARQPTGATTAAGQPAASGALPPPRSNLGLRLDRGRDWRSGSSSSRGLQGLAPVGQPRQYYQNLGGYTPPQPALDWLPPGGGY